MLGLGSPARSPRFSRKYEKLLTGSPRTLQIACGLVLAVLALEFLAEVVFAEWFYATYHRDYAYTLESRTIEWVYGLCVTLLALWMLGMSWRLLRGAPTRDDRGLFSPPALRVWGLIFAVMPVLMIAMGAHGLAHMELLFWCWIASGACFALASRRARTAPSAEASHESSRPID